jgi:mRNA-degrading endonuclease toxin of MazEF toxin-antitoxin module
MKRGDVVEVDWTFSHQTGSKIRPAVVVRADYLSAIIDDTILVQITGQIHGITGTEVIIDPALEPLSGLAKKCVVHGTATCVARTQ